MIISVFFYQIKSTEPFRVLVHVLDRFLWGCSSAGLERLPVTQKVAGSSPVTPATIFLALGLRPNRRTRPNRRVFLLYAIG